MEDEKMVRMANQIAEYFTAYPEDRARGEVAAHLRAFWEPRMRRQLVAYARDGGVGLHPFVAHAATELEAGGDVPGGAEPRTADSAP